MLLSTHSPSPLELSTTFLFLFCYYDYFCYHLLTHCYSFYLTITAIVVIIIIIITIIKRFFIIKTCHNSFSDVGFGCCVGGRRRDACPRRDNRWPAGRPAQTGHGAFYVAGVCGLRVAWATLFHSAASIGAIELSWEHTAGKDGGFEIEKSKRQTRTN